MIKKEDYSSSAYMGLAEPTITGGKVKFFSISAKKTSTVTSLPDNIAGIVNATINAPDGINIPDDIADIANVASGFASTDTAGVTIPGGAMGSTLPVVGGTGVGVGGGSSAGPVDSGY